MDMGREDGAGTIAVSPGPSRARHMWLNPSFEPMSDHDLVIRVEVDAEPLEYLAGHFAPQV